MSNSSHWLNDFSVVGSHALVDGLVPVQSYRKTGRPPEEVAIMERAAHYKADAVFFQAPRHGKAAEPQAFLYRSDGPAQDSDFAKLHQRLWSWGGVPLVYRATRGLVQLFRCAHRPDFEHDGEIVCKPFKTLDLAAQIAQAPWWDAERLRTGTIWDDPSVCKQLLSSRKAAQKTLIEEIKNLHEYLNAKAILPKPLRRRLLILSVLIAYLEKRGVFETSFFARFLIGANHFFQVLANGPALVDLLNHLEDRFNGHVFTLSEKDRQKLYNSGQLARYAQLVEGRQRAGGQLTLWQRYSFADLPVELISQIYQLFVKDKNVAIYTPHFVVRLMLGEILSWDRLDQLEKSGETILDPACGSGVFLVEAFKRVVLHWRFRNDWARPSPKTLKTLLINRLRGIDLEEGAVELAAFSLCLALCDALEPMEIRTSIGLFPPLKEETIITGCFFDLKAKHGIRGQVGVVVGNPPFASRLITEGAEQAYQRYQQNWGILADKQIAYLFLHESMELLSPGGVLSMLQQYNFLYNQRSIDFRQRFIQNWDVREVLDFISIPGIFRKGGSKTKAIVIVVEARPAPSNRQILHATFRRSGRAEAEQGFDIDYYDMHWLPRELVLNNDAVWRCNLLGGGRVLDFVNRLKKLRTIGQYASEKGWDYGEGYIEDDSGASRPASHIVGKPLLPSEAISESGIDASAITTASNKPIQRPRSESRFTPPMLLIREHMDLFHDLWVQHYLTYKHEVVGFSSLNRDDIENLQEIGDWIKSEIIPLRAFVAATSVRLFTQRATSISSIDIINMPYPPDHSLNLSDHEKILSADIVQHYRELIRLGEKSSAMKKTGVTALKKFNETFSMRINGIYRKNKLYALESQTWPGVICQPYVFGKGKVDWSGADELKGKINALLEEKRGGGLQVARIARLYDGACIYLLKPDQLRYWLRSIALRDADETIADLAEQGF